jgi:glutathione S-transferase
MPALILMSGEVLIESAAILDYLDDIVGPSRALLPVAGEPRRRCLRILASATAACDKAIAISYERRRPSERIFVDWIARCRTQLDAVLAALDSFKRLSWPIHDRLMQTDITTLACSDMSDVWSLAPYRTAATPTSKNWERDAKSIRLSRPVLRLPSRQHGISRLRPAKPGHTELGNRHHRLS